MIRTGHTTPFPTVEGSIYTVVLTSPTADKVEGVTRWIHLMRVKRAYHSDPEDAEWNTQKALTDPRETNIILKKKKR